MRLVRNLRFAPSAFAALFVSTALAVLAPGQAHAGPVFKAEVNPVQASATIPFALDLKTLLSDPGNGALTWATFADKPAWVTLNSAAGTLSGTPSLADVGAKSFTISVKDNDAGSIAQIALTVVVTPVWVTQQLDLGTAKEDSAFTFDLKGKITVPGNGPVTFSVEDPAKLPGWLTLSPNGTLSGTPRRPDVGAFSGIVFVARTPSGGEARTTAFGRVEKTIKPPKWKQNPFTLADANEDFEYRQEVSGTAFVDNFEQAALTFSLVAGTPTGWLQLSGDGVFSGIPGKNDVGPVSVRARLSAVIDGQTYTDETVFKLTVIHTNHAPKWLADPIVLPGATVKVGYSQSVAAQAQDPDDGDKLTFRIVSGPAWATMTSAGVLSGTPQNADIGDNEWTIEVSDGELKAVAKARVRVSKRPVVWTNKPTILPNANEDFFYSKNLTAYVTNPDGDPLTFTLVSGPSWVTVTPAGVFAGTPGAADVGQNVFRLKVSNGITPDDETEARLTVIHTNHAPKWTQDPIVLPNIKERLPFNGDVSTYAKDPDAGDTLTFAKVSGPSWLTVGPTGELVGTPQRPNVGLNTFVLKVTDQDGLSAQVTVQVTVEKVPLPPRWKQNPIVLSDATQDTAFSFDLKPFAESQEGQPLTFRLVSGPDWLRVAADGKVSGTPKLKDVGNFTAVFEVDDGLTARADGQGKVIKKFYPPVINAAALKFTVKERSTLSDNLNQPKYVQEVNGDPLTFELVDTPSWLTLAPGGALTMSPLFAHIGNHKVRFRVSNGTLSSQGTMDITVVRDPRPPVWKQNPIVFETKARLPFSATLADKAQDLDGLALTFSKKSGPAWLSVAANGTISGTPGDEHLGDNAFVVTVRNDQLGADADVVVKVLFNPHPPVVHQANLVFTVKERSVFTENLSQPKYVTDVDGDNLTFTLLDNAAWVKLESNGQLTLSPQFPQIGDHQFRFQVSDGGLTADGTLRIKVVRDPRPPVWKENPIVFETKARVPFSATVAGKAQDLDGFAISYSKKSGPAWLTVAANGAISGTPGDEHVGDNSFVLTVKNDVLGADATVVVKVLYNNHAPFWAKDPIDLPQGVATEAYAQSVAEHARDIDPNDKLTFTKVSGPAWAQVSSTGQVVGTPLMSDIGQNTLKVRVTDLEGLFADVTVRIRIIKPNSPPRWLQDPVRLADAFEDKAYAFDVAPLATDEDGDKLTFRKISGPDWLAMAPDGKLSGTPLRPHVGSYTAVFEVSDGKAAVQVNAVGKVIKTPKPPVIHQNALSFTVKERSTLSESLNQPKYVENVDGDPLTFSLLDASDWVTLSAEGQLTIKPLFKHIGDHQLKFRVANGPAVAYGVLRIKVVRDPRPPVWNESPIVFETEAREPFTAELSTKAKDLDGLALTFSKVSGPAWLTVAANGRITGTPGDEHLGDNVFVVNVKNDQLGADATVIVKVLFNNHPPYWTQDPIRLPNAVATEGYAQSVAPFAKDPDTQDVLTFAKVSGPAWATIGADGQVTGTPAKSDIGLGTFKVKVSDPSGLSAVVTVEIPVVKPNTPPKWLQDPVVFPNATATVPYAFNLKPLATDEDNDPLTFRKVSGPAWLVVNADGTVSGTPAKEDIGDFTAILEVTDGKTPVQVSAKGKVVPKAQPPVVHQNALSFKVKERATLTVNLNQPQYVTDPEGLPLTFTLVDTADWVTLTDKGDLTAKPLFKHIGKHSLRFRVSNGYFTTNGTLSIEVERDPRPPVWSENPIRFTAKARVPFRAEIGNKVKDLDGIALTIEKRSGNAWLSVSPNGVLSGTPQNDVVGENQFVIVARNDLLGAETVVIITVEANNRPPYWTQDPISLPDAKVGKLYAQSVGDKAKDPDQDPITFQKISGPDWAFVSTSGAILGTPNPGDVGMTTLVVRVSDPWNGSADATVKILVQSNIHPPKWLKDPIPLGDVRVGTNFAFDLAPFAVDEDGNPLTFKKISGPGWLQCAPDGKLSGVPAEADLGPYTAVFEVSNGQFVAQVNGFGRVIPAGNQPPYIVPQAMHFVMKERQVLEENLNQPKYVSDPDGDTLTFELANPAGWVQLAADGKLRLAPLAPQVGDHTFGVRISDGKHTVVAAMFVRVLPDPLPPMWLENPIRMTAKVNEPFKASVADKAKDPGGAKLTFSKKNGPDWLSVAEDGSLSGTPKQANLGENVFTLVVRNSQFSAETTLIVTVKEAGPVTDVIVVDEAVPSAPAENLWVIDNGSSCSGISSKLIKGLKDGIRGYYDTLEGKGIHHTNAYLSSDFKKWKGLPLAGSDGDVLFGWKDSDPAQEFVERLAKPHSGKCENSPIWVMFRFYGQAPQLSIYDNGYFTERVPMDVMIVTAHADRYKAYAKGTAQASWTPSDYARSFKEFHAQEKQPYRVSAIAPDCPSSVSEPVSMGNNPYKVVVNETGGTYFPVGCNFDMNRALQEYAQQVIFRAYVSAKHRIPLSKKPSSELKVSLAGIPLPATKWHYDAAKNEVIVHWHLIDLGALKPGDKLVIEYRG